MINIFSCNKNAFLSKMPTKYLVWDMTMPKLDYDLFFKPRGTEGCKLGY